MSILAFDTCLGAISVAIGWSDDDGRRQMVSAHEPCATGHAERLLPMLDEVVRQCPVLLRGIQRIAVTIGPGTFTGVRTGIAAARAMALSTGAPVVGMTSLALIRAGVTGGTPETGRPLAIAVDARRGEIYLLAPEQGADAGGAGEIVVLTAAAAARRLPESCLVAGSAAALVVAAADAAGRHLEAIAGEHEPDARLLANLAQHLRPLASVTPLYIRAPDAKLPTAAALPRLRAQP